MNYLNMNVPECIQTLGPVFHMTIPTNTVEVL